MSRWNESPGSTPTKAVKLEKLGGYRLRVTFSDGAVGETDLTGLAQTDAPMTRPLRDPAYFARVFLEAGAPTWPNGLDLAPWALHADMKSSGALSYPEVRPAE